MTDLGLDPERPYTKGTFFFVPADQEEPFRTMHSVDVTEAVRVMYDMVVTSQDWGSNFFSDEDTGVVVELGRIAGFDVWKDGQKYVTESQHLKEAAVLWDRIVNEAYPTSSRHLHKFLTPSSVCAYPNCYVEGGSDMFKKNQEFEEKVEGRIAHEHVYTSVGWCVWPKCNEALRQ